MDVRYPIGKFELREVVTKEDVHSWISELDAAPQQLMDAVEGLDEEQLATPYRDGGWKVSQVVHHLADAHLNAYVRVKLAITEDHPTVKTFEEVLWAELPDNDLPVDVSLTLFAATHQRLVVLLKALGEDQFKRTINHPDNGTMSVENLVAIYAWHGKHHIAHITNLREKMGW